MHQANFRGDRIVSNEECPGYFPSDQGMQIHAIGATVSCTSQRFFVEALKSTLLTLFVADRRFWERNLADLVKRTLDRPLGEYHEGLTLHHELALPIAIPPRQNRYVEVSFGSELLSYLMQLQQGGIPGRFSLRVLLLGMKSRDVM